MVSDIYYEKSCFRDKKLRKRTYVRIKSISSLRSVLTMPLMFKGHYFGGRSILWQI